MTSKLCRIAVAMIVIASCGDSPSSLTPEWQLSDELLRIGAVGVSEAEFHLVTGAVRLSSGEIAVANGGSNQVRYFGPDGSFRRSFGQQGAGPGEFQSMGPLIRFGDTLAVHDGRNGRITVFRSDSLLASLSVRPTNSTERFSVHDRLGDGRWLASTGVSPRFSSRPYRDSITVGIFPASGEGEIQLLRTFPGPWIVSIEGQITGLAAFFSWASSKVAGGEIVVVDADQDELRRFTADGTELPGAAIPVHGQLLTPELIDQAKLRETGSGENAVPPEWIDVRYDPDVLPSHVPFRGFLVDADTLIWLEADRADQSPGQYFVLSLDARLLAVVDVPAGFRATDIGADYCLGIETDADGVETIVMYRLTRH